MFTKIISELHLKHGYIDYYWYAKIKHNSIYRDQEVCGLKFLISYSTQKRKEDDLVLILSIIGWHKN